MCVTKVACSNSASWCHPLSWLFSLTSFHKHFCLHNPSQDSRLIISNRNECKISSRLHVFQRSESLHMCAHACIQSWMCGIGRVVSLQVCSYPDLECVSGTGSGLRSKSLSRRSTLVLKRVSGKLSPLQDNTEHLPVPALTDNIAPCRCFPWSVSSDA